jgi:hypothetical protein
MTKVIHKPFTVESFPGSWDTLEEARAAVESYFRGFLERNMRPLPGQRAWVKQWHDDGELAGQWMITVGFDGSATVYEPPEPAKVCPTCKRAM